MDPFPEQICPEEEDDDDSFPDGKFQEKEHGGGSLRRRL